jgi:hypothetical protein
MSTNLSRLARNAVLLVSRSPFNQVPTLPQKVIFRVRARTSCSSPAIRHFSDSKKEQGEPGEQDWNKTVRNRAIRSFSILFVAMGAMAYALSQTYLSTKNTKSAEVIADSSSEHPQSVSLLGYDFAQMEKEWNEFQEFRAFKRYKEQQRLREQLQAEGESPPSTP